MKRKIKLEKEKIEYTFKESRRARRMKLAVYCDGNFVVTAPQGIGLEAVESFIVQKSNWIIGKLEYFKKFGNMIFMKGDRKDYLKYKQEARALAESRVEYFNGLYCFKFNRINIKNQKSRWGSCSRKGNLNFNYKIALLPERSADYIIVHELCHLGEFNHSKKFWHLIARALPDFSDLRKELKSGVLKIK